MKAIQYLEANKIEVRDISMLKVPAGYGLIKVSHAGICGTDLNINLINDEKRNADIAARIPMDRWGTSEDIKGLAIFLASKASDYMSGAVIPVDGGYLGK